MLRTSVTSFDLQIMRLKELATLEEYRAAADELLASWPTLLKLLALGQAAELRECPRCHHLGMRDATRCGYCWTPLTPQSSGS